MEHFAISPGNSVRHSPASSSIAALHSPVLFSFLIQNTGDWGSSKISASQKQVARAGTWSVILWYIDTYCYIGFFSAAKSSQQLHMLDLSDFMRYGTTEIGLRPPDYLLPLYQNNSYPYSPSWIHPKLNLPVKLHWFKANHKSFDPW